MTDDVMYSALSVASRRRVLQAVREAQAPPDVKTLAEATGLHLNTVRFHLDVLIQAGYVTHSTDRRVGRGRPRGVYLATESSTAEGGYKVLAEMLASQLQDTAVGVDIAQRAGHMWAAQATQAAADDRTDPLDAATRQAVTLFTGMGFDPRPAAHGNGTRIELHACPFLDVAQRHPGIVCGAHLGMLRAAVNVDKRDAFSAELFPFARPGVCIAELAPAVAEDRR